jgi:hypothetical protein
METLRKSEHETLNIILFPQLPVQVGKCREAMVGQEERRCDQVLNSLVLDTKA